jgi:phage head maturation protease
MQLPAFIQHIAKDLMQERGMPESEAIATAIAQCKRWAAGGPGVKPETRAKAAAAVAEWERLKASAHVKRGGMDMSAAGDILASRSFNAAAHPRVGKGNAGGGQFAPASSGSGTKDGKGTRATPSNAHPVGMGETGQRVHDLQERLNALGAHLAVDGKFGPKTRAAVEAFQRSHGLKVDALVGPKTTAALRLKHPAGPHKAPGHKPAVHKPPAHTAPVKRSADSGYDEDGLDSSWDGDLSDLPDLTGLGVADFEAIAGDDQGVSRMAKLGSGGRFKALKAKLAAKGASDPGALAAYIGRKKFGRKKFTALAAKAHKGGGGMHRAELFRSYPLEDYHIVRTGEGDSSGRVIEAYMTVFDEGAEIRDHQGHYREQIDRSAFNKRISDLERSRNGFAAAKVFYNHGMTIHGSPSDRYSMPVAVCEGIRAESRGPVTRSRYLDTPLGNEVLEMWRSGAVTAQSFTGAIIRSSPELRPGQRYSPRNGQLQSVRRLELGLKEYGPTPFPAYQGAELVGVRMSPLGTWTAADDDDETDELGRTGPEDEALPPGGEAATGGPPEVHPSRDHAHRLLVMRTEQMCREAGIASRKGEW